MDIFYGRVRVSGQFLWLGGGKWGWVEVYFWCVGVGGHLLWMGGGRWTFTMGGWG